MKNSKLKDGVIPSFFEWNNNGQINVSSESSDDESNENLERGKKKSVPESCAQVQPDENRSLLYAEPMEIASEPKDVEKHESILENTKQSQALNKKEYRDQGVQYDVNDFVNYESVHTQTEGSSMRNQHAQTNPKSFSVYDFESDKKGLHFYTGLENFEKFKFVYETLGPARFHLTYYKNSKPPAKIDVEYQFFLTLIYLRLHKTFYELGVMFKITEKQAHNIAVTWIRFMYLQWKRINIWPSKDLVNFHAPQDFYSKYPGTRVILDGTEIPILKPSLPVAQQSTFSTYKHKNTIKLLVGATPAGLVSYVSPTFGGSTSDRQIVERMDLAQKCDPGDHIMADKGFDVDDLLAPYRIHVNIPTYFCKKNRIAPNVIRRDRKIASKRVHIERIIGLGKTYAILKGPLRKSEIFLADEITFVCFMLCNFRKRIVGDDA